MATKSRRFFDRCQILFIIFLLLPHPLGHAFTHWALEDGIIKYQDESLYTLHSPGDLLLFIAQAKAADELRSLEKKSADLMRQQKLLRSVEIERLDRERLAFFSDPDCRITQKKLSDFDLYLSSFLRLEAKKIKIEDFADYKVQLPEDKEKFTKPYCNSEFAFSMHSYDHLKGVGDRKLLINASEAGLVNPIPHAKKLEEFGHRINVALEKNETSWVLLNFASIYWRVAGNAYYAVECLRRALHYSPRKHKDLALVSLANILHRSKYSLDAAILMHAALEMTTDYDIVYFTLGNIYGALGQFDLADICYKYVSDLQPAFEAARLRMHAARCEFKLGSPLENPKFQDDIDELEEMVGKQQLIEDTHKGHLADRSSPLRKYNMYSDIQPPAHERGDYI